MGRPSSSYGRRVKGPKTPSGLVRFFSFVGTAPSSVRVSTSVVWCGGLDYSGERSWWVGRGPSVGDAQREVRRRFFVNPPSKVVPFSMGPLSPVFFPGLGVET